MAWFRRKKNPTVEDLPEIIGYRSPGMLDFPPNHVVHEMYGETWDSLLTGLQYKTDVDIWTGNGNRWPIREGDSWVPVEPELIEPEPVVEPEPEPNLLLQRHLDL